MVCDTIERKKERKKEGKKGQGRETCIYLISSYLNSHIQTYDLHSIRIKATKAILGSSVQTARIFNNKNYFQCLPNYV